MSNGSVPLPQSSDFQMENTQAMMTQVSAMKELATEAVSLGFRLYQNHKHKPPQVEVQVREGTTHKDLWKKYSEGIQSERPVQRTLSVARTALKEGATTEQVQKILIHDPQFAKIEQQQGSESAKIYTKVMTRSAQKREQCVNTNQQQQSQKQQKARNLSQKKEKGL